LPSIYHVARGIKVRFLLCPSNRGMALAAYVSVFLRLHLPICDAVYLELEFVLLHGKCERAYSVGW
jgi:hypothetical protein